MSQLRLAESGILYINPDPAHYHVSAFFPNVVQLSGTELVCVYQRGDGMYAANSNVSLLRSLDGGVSWADEGCLHDPSRDDRPYSYHGTFVSRVSDGTLVAFPLRADRSDPDQPFFSESGGLMANEPVLLLSRDQGRTWTDPEPVPLPGLVASPAQSVIELSGGRWLAAFAS